MAATSPLDGAYDYGSGGNTSVKSMKDSTSRDPDTYIYHSMGVDESKTVDYDIDVSNDNIQDESYRETRSAIDKINTYAVMRVLVTPNLKNNTDSEGAVSKKAKINVIPPYTRFFIQGTNEPDSERMQIFEGFDDFWVKFSGRKPRFYTYQGTLLNFQGGEDKEGADWYNDWKFNYDEYLRGSKCVERSAEIFLKLEDRLVSGFIFNTQMSKSSSTAKGQVPFSFSMVILEDVPISPRVGYRNRQVINQDSYAQGVLKAQQDRLNQTGAINIIRDYLRGKDSGSGIM